MPSAPPGSFPMYNPETGQWMGMSMGMGMYPYPAPFFPTAPMVRPEFFSNSMGYRGYRGMSRGRFPRRGRGQNRGRGGYQSYDADQYYNKYPEYEDTHDHRHSKYSRSR